MTKEITNKIMADLGSNSVVETRFIQSLWSDYGALFKVDLEGHQPKQGVVKHINLANAKSHPRGWNTSISHQRKITSYEVEMFWYKNYQTNHNIYMPKCFTAFSIKDQHVIVMEDLDHIGFSKRHTAPGLKAMETVLRWLAQFHAFHMGASTKGLWEVGTYWHLTTRPDEWGVMQDPKLKAMASTIDDRLNNCTYKTLVHGDAKLANFCFSNDSSRVAAVDFQYIGGGCGMKDVVYFIGSALDEENCARYESILLDTYFNELSLALQSFHPKIDAIAVEKEWRSMYALAWTDFTRFLIGWMPTHHKLNAYSKALRNQTLLGLLEN